MSDNGVKYLKVSEVAEIMRVSKTTVYRLLYSGELPFIRPSARCMRIPEPAVLNLLALDVATGDGGVAPPVPVSASRGERVLAALTGQDQKGGADRG